MSTAKTIAPLSSSYTNIASLSSQKCGLKVPITLCNIRREDESVCLATEKTEWLDHMREHVEEQTKRNEEDIQKHTTQDVKALYCHFLQNVYIV